MSDVSKGQDMAGEAKDELVAAAEVVSDPADAGAIEIAAAAKRKRRGFGGKKGHASAEDSSAITDPNDPDYVDPDKEAEGAHAGGDWTGGSTKKAKNFGPSFKRLIGLLAPERAVMFWVVILVIGNVVLTVIGPKVLGLAMDQIFKGFFGDLLGPNGAIGSQFAKGGMPLTSNQQAVDLLRQSKDSASQQLADAIATSGAVPGVGIDFGALGRLILIVLFMYLVASLLMWWSGYLLNALVMRVVYKLRADVAAKINRLPLSYFDTRQRGDLMSRVTNDVDNVQTALQQGVTQLLQSLLTIIGIGVMMFVVSWLMALIALIAIPLSGVIAGVIGTRSQKLFAAQWKTTGQLNGHIEESYSGLEIVRAYGRSDEMIKGFDDRNERLYKASFGAQFLSLSIFPAMQFVSYLSYALIAVVGGLRVASGQMTLGDATAFIQYSREFSQPIGQIAGLFNQLQSGVASGERTFELLDEDEEEPDKPTRSLPDDTDGHVDFEHVAFSYSDDKPLIKDLSFSAEPGHTIAIVGPTGAGKTTLVNLIMRFYELTGGTITVDGVNVRDLSRQDLRSNVGMVLQDTWLFDGTIRENIRYGRLDATDDEVVAAATACMVDRFVRQLPDGYDTELESNGGNLSAGERQLVTIARAFINDPALLILDEATSSVDTRTEILVQQAMNALRAGRTSFVIAHRLSTIRDADTILFMENGDISEMGSHSALMQRESAYYKLYMSQFEGTDKDLVADEQTVS